VLSRHILKGHKMLVKKSGYLLFLSFMLTGCGHDIPQFTRSLPLPKTVYLKPQETIQEFARREGLTEDVIRQCNHISPYITRPHQGYVWLPPSHIVRKGEVLDQIVAKYNVSRFELLKLNGLKEGIPLQTGMRLFLIEPKKCQEFFEYRQRISQEKVGPAPLRGSLTLPVQGTLLKGYGDMKDGKASEGLSIAAPLGMGVMAADEGEVIHAGPLNDFGKTIILRHQKGWVTIYAHLHDIWVTDKKWVKKGQVIGHVGKSGRVTIPQLYFELKYKTKSVNPTPYLHHR
jgi:LysM repeat protein